MPIAIHICQCDKSNISANGISIAPKKYAIAKYSATVATPISDAIHTRSVITPRSVNNPHITPTKMITSGSIAQVPAMIKLLKNACSTGTSW